VHAKDNSRKQTLERSILHNHYLRLQQQMTARIRSKPPTPPITPDITLVDEVAEVEFGIVAVKEVAGIVANEGFKVGAAVGAEVGVGTAAGAEVGVDTASGAEVGVSTTGGAEVEVG
jgi:hypothetical protein